MRKALRKNKSVESLKRKNGGPQRRGASLIAQLVMKLPAMQETWVRFLGQEDALEKEMATHSSILAWRIPWTQKSDGLQSIGSHMSRTRLSD